MIDGIIPAGPIVVTGHQGLLGSAFCRALSQRTVVGLGRADLDPSDPSATRRRLAEVAPVLIVNCAADTDVEGAEADPARAIAVNATLAGTLAEAAAEHGAAMLHISSTGCYGDWKGEPYVEWDELRPTTAHHRSKAEGEALVQRAHPKPLILRLGWVFGGVQGQRKNFAWARIVEARGKEVIGSNPHQRGCPTSASDVVTEALVLVRAENHGVYNCVGAGEPATRLEYVAAILREARSTTRVEPMEYPRRAAVSPNETARNAQGAVMPPWRASLGTFMRELLNP